MIVSSSTLCIFSDVLFYNEKYTFPGKCVLQPET